MRFLHFSNYKMSYRTAHVTTLALAVLLLFSLASLASAQTFSVLHAFSGPEGSNLYGGLTEDASGSLYGTTYGGGSGNGTVFRLRKQGNSWIVSTLHIFQGGADGGGPTGNLVFGPDGALYGTTQYGGTGPCVDGSLLGCGTVFQMTPGISPCPTVSCPWHETVIHNFADYPDGSSPISGVTFDRAGNIYGTTFEGGNLNNNCSFGCGTVYELSPSSGGWTETVLFRFSGDDGSYVAAGVVLDAAGNVYGTADQGGPHVYGTVFELIHSSGGWQEQTLYAFQGAADGGSPFGGVTLDAAGDLYGSTFLGGTADGGTVYKLIQANGHWTENVIWNAPANGGGPYDAPLMDSAGNLYLTTMGLGADYSGNIFKLSPSGGSWVYTDLHDLFAQSDGDGPWASPVMDAQGNLFGTTVGGGPHNGGTVWQIAP